MIERIVKLSGVRELQLEIAGLELGDKVVLIEDYDRPGGYVVLDDRNNEIGRLTERNAVSQMLEGGGIVFAAEVNSISDRDDQLVPAIRMTIGDENEAYVPSAAAVKSYSVNIVGESFRQLEIGRTRVGEKIRLIHVTDNIYDPRAVAVLNESGEQIGFLPRDGWLTDALVEEQKRYVATVLDIIAPKAGRSFTAVVLKVSLVSA